MTMITSTTWRTESGSMINNLKSCMKGWYWWKR